MGRARNREERSLRLVHSLICEVRRRVERPEGGYGYGCEFVEMATKQEDLLYRYILRRQGDQLRRIR